MFLISLVIGLSQSPTCKCWFVGFQNFLIFLLKTIHIFKRLFFFFEKIWLSAPGTQARAAGWAAVFGDLVIMDAAAPWSEPPSALPWTTAVASCRVCLFLLLILCSRCLTQQSVWWFKIYVSFHCSPQFKPHVTSDLSQSPNPTKGLQGPPWSALPLWPFQPWLDLFHSSRQILWLLCCFPVLPSLFPLSVFSADVYMAPSRLPFGCPLRCHSLSETVRSPQHRHLSQQHSLSASPDSFFSVTLITRSLGLYLSFFLH